MIGNDLLRYNLNGKKFLVMDFETESLNLFFARPWQLSWIICEGRNIVSEHDHFLKWPNLSVSKEAAEKTKFSQAKIDEKGESPASVLAKFDRFLYDEQYFIVGTNILGFDAYIHNSLRRLCGFKPDYSWINRLYDVNCLAKAWKLSLRIHNDDLLNQQYQLYHFVQRGLKTNLSQLCKDFEIDFDPERMHDGLYDVFKTKDVFFSLVNHIEIK